MQRTEKASRKALRTIALGVGAASLLTLPLVSEFRLKQAIQPLTDAWQRLPIEPRRSTLLGIRFRSPQVGLYHMDRTRRPKPLTRPGWPLSQKRSRRRERKATKRWRKQDRRDGLHPAKWPIFVRI